MKLKHLKITAVVSLLGTLLSSGCAHSPLTARTQPRPTDKPSRVMILVFDQMRPDYIDRFDLKNFKRLRAMSVNYTEATVGYIGAETVVSHLVIPSGLPPSLLPWKDDVFLDYKGIIGPAGSVYATGGIPGDKMTALMNTLPPDIYLPYELKKKFGGKVFAVAQKDYAAFAFGTTQADGVITLKKANGVCTPTGIQVPDFITKNSRYTLQCKETYGTETTYYPLDGNRFVPGNDPDHLGGDPWVADVGIDLMNHEDWSGLFLSFGAIDKIGHALAEQDGKSPIVIDSPYSLPKIAAIADEQLGRILDELEKKNLLKETVILLTADHGAQTNIHYLGNGKTSKWGQLKNETSKDAPFWVQQITGSNEVNFSFQDSAIRVWLKDASHFQKTVEQMKSVPGITEIYHLKNLNGIFNYHRIFSNLSRQPKKFQGWAKNTSQEITNALASEGAPELVGLLADGVGFDLLGDHGGAQEKVQRIPFFVSTPLQRSFGTEKTDEKKVHLYDTKKIILHELE